METKRFRTKMFAATLAAAMAASAAFAAETAGLVTDEIGVVMVKIRKGARIFIGGYWTLCGPDIALGIDQKRGVEIDTNPKKIFPMK